MPDPAPAPHLEWTEDREANRLIAESPLALLIGFCLDQQIPIEHAFLGPQRIRERLGTLDAVRLAAADPDAFTAAFRRPPAIHHFGVMPPGWEEVAPDWPSLASVTTAEERRAYQASKRAQKAAMRAEGAARA